MADGDRRKAEGQESGRGGLQSVGDTIVEYGGFVLLFLRTPSGALAPDRRSGSLSGRLVGAALGSVAVAWAFMEAVSDLGAPPDPGNVARTTQWLAGGLGPERLGVAFVIALLVVGVAVHVVGRLVGVVGRGKDAHLRGTATDTVNAMLALAGAMLPVVAGTIAVLRLSERWTDPGTAAGIAGLLLGSFIVGYAVLALRAAHHGPPNTATVMP